MIYFTSVYPLFLYWSKLSVFISVYQKPVLFVPSCLLLMKWGGEQWFLQSLHPSDISFIGQSRSIFCRIRMRLPQYIYH